MIPLQRIHGRQYRFTRVGALLPFLALFLASASCALPRPRGVHLSVGALQPGRAALEETAGKQGSPRVALVGAGGEWLDFTATLSGEAVAVRLGPLRSLDPRGASPPLTTTFYRIADVPADTNHAGFLRLYGGTGQSTSQPRVLIPLPQFGGACRLPPRREGEALRLWIDLLVPHELPRGTWQTALEILNRRGRVIASVPVELRTHGFDLPAQRSLVISAPLGWQRLAELWPGEFSNISPPLVSRGESAHARAVALLDELIASAQAHRLQLTVPALAPIVKWPAGTRPQCDWRDYDALVSGWLTGEAFADGVGLRHWPAPRMQGLEEYSEQARAEYWAAALAHLEEAGWIDRVVVFADAGAQQLTPMDRMRLSQAAGHIARAHRAGRIAVPLESDEVRFTGPEHPDMFPPEDAHRLVILAEGLVTDHASRPWPAGLPQPQRYLDADGPSPAPMPGPGASEADVRLLGWLAFLRAATHVRLADPLVAAGPASGADPTRLVWFYPGDAFGHSGPLPTVQLKWLRRAQQDYEYLALAAARTHELYARVIARALVRPVRAQQGVAVDPVLPLIAGTPEAALWREGLSLVADKVALTHQELRPQLPPRFEIEHTNRTTTWLAPRERPVPLITRTRWDVSGGGEGAARLVLQVGASIYNPSDAHPEGLSLSFVEMPGGETPRDAVWEDAGTVQVPSISTYEVGEATLASSAGVDELALVFPTFQQGPMRLEVRNQYTGAAGFASAVAPAMVIDQRAAAPDIDGRLDDWLGNEAIVDGRMVLMHSRPALQSGQVQRAPNPAQAFVGWTSDGLHVAFRLEDAQRTPDAIQTARNFVDTEYRRVWGEDVCEILIRPVWAQNGQTVDGPLLHVICKTDGAFVRRRTDRRTAAQPWQNFESGMRFAATVDEKGVWRGELTLPWSALRDATTEEQLGDAGRHARPALLRFNLSQHDGETGRSASWAGPVDFGADEYFTGALLLRQGRR